MAATASCVTAMGLHRAISDRVSGLSRSRRAKVRDRGDVSAERENPLHLVDPAEVGAANEEFSMRCCRFSTCVEVSTGDFQEVLTALLGKDAPNLSPAVITRLTAEWQPDYDAWQKRDLSARQYVYVWADGVYLQARMEEARRMHAGADRRDTRGQEGTRRLPDRGARDVPGLRRLANPRECQWFRCRAWTWERLGSPSCWCKARSMENLISD